MSTSISKVNIEEANSHLRKLHKKVFELENRIQMQALHVEELQKVNAQLQQQLGKVTRQSALEISELTQRLENSEGRVQRLLGAAQERDATVLQLEKKARLFYEVVEHRTAISHILEVLEELSIPDEDIGEGGKVILAVQDSVKGVQVTPGGHQVRPESQDTSQDTTGEQVRPGSQDTTGEQVINTKGQNGIGRAQNSLGSGQDSNESCRDSAGLEPPMGHVKGDSGGDAEMNVMKDNSNS